MLTYPWSIRFNCLYYYSHIYVQGVSYMVPLSTVALLRRSASYGLPITAAELRDTINATYCI